MALVSKNFSDIVTFTRASTASYRDSTGTRQTAAINSPRLDFSAAGVALGFLVEDQRTNFFLNSGAPATQTITLSTTGSYTLWIEGSGSVAVAAGTATGSGFGTATAGTPVTFSITAGGTVTCTVTGTPTIAQLENGAFATSYIATSGAAATRAADVATINALSPWFNAAEGTILVEAQLLSTASNRFMAALSDGTINNEIALYAATSTQNLVTTGGVTQGNVFGGSVSALTTLKDGFAYKANDLGAAFNGTSLGTDASASIPTVDRMTLGRRVDGTFQMNGWLRKLTYYPSRLTNAQLQSLTS